MSLTAQESKPIITVDTFATCIRETLEDLGLKTKPLEAGIQTAAKNIYNNCRDLVGEEPSNRFGVSFLDFKRKAKINLDWQKGYGTTSTTWGLKCLKDFRLFYLNPFTLRSNFEGNLTWRENYGITGEQWLKACMRQTVLFRRDPEKLRQIFEDNLKWARSHGIPREAWIKAHIEQPTLSYTSRDKLEDVLKQNLASFKPHKVSKKRLLKINLHDPVRFFQSPENALFLFEYALALAESPFFRIIRNPQKLGFRPLRVNNIFNRGYVSLDNLLLRTAFAEITNPKPSSNLLNANRSDIEAKLVEALGHDPKDEIIPLAQGCDIEALKTEALQLERVLRNYAKGITARVKSEKAPNEPRPMEASILTVLLPEDIKTLAVPDQRLLLLRRLAQGGLFKHYRFGN